MVFPRPDERKQSPSGDRHGLVVASSQVRLQPSVGDGYASSVTDTKKSLLRSDLGSGSVGLYKSICGELERDHVPREESGPARSDEEESGSFTAKIRGLECANHKLKDELDRHSIHLQGSLGEVRTLQGNIRRLQDELDSSSSRETHLEDELVRVTNGITEAMRVLQDYQAKEWSRPKLHEGRRRESGDSKDSKVLGIPQFPYATKWLD
ncbi:hypothetical protein N7508_006097 [Penicillium antarcticum]|uniref:uncharacterized protein n=1 Tax=Penicillium antarcticum TaxID=416450 RepID=UPI00239014CD|nr:uncharacterized protein N7508_006097 [Penicillium antarcticum]KAJ5301234.1 hypothetical protein N7508_006097 [Penicillium antarcticum]